MTKYVFVTGGVVSSLGKGITVASLGALLIDRGVKVAAMKLDPYLNVDPGTMNPLQHGEVFVTADGAETDLDIGHYERFMDTSLTAASNATTGKIYAQVLANERRGDYLGATVQIIPHVTNEIKRRIYDLAKVSQADVMIVEVGGTVGDIEGQPFLEAIRQIRRDVGSMDTLYVHVTLLPYVGAAGELKTKPTQHSVNALRSIGIHPDVLVCRTDHELTPAIRQKISLFTDVDEPAIIENRTMRSIYEVPRMFADQNLDRLVVDRLGLPDHHGGDLVARMTAMVDALARADRCVTVALVGKYVALGDAYISVVEAVHHAAAAVGVVDIRYVDAEVLEHSDPGKWLAGAKGIIVPGGYGPRGVEGKITAIRYAREHGVPCLGLCLGMQCMVIEYARTVCGYGDANSTEFNEATSAPVLTLLDEQRNVVDKGGTMRLGNFPCALRNNSVIARCYATGGSAPSVVDERHRHRWEVNAAYRPILEDNGLVISGASPDGELVEAVELPTEVHPFFVGTQFHPELTSRPMRPHPLFVGLLKAMFW